MSFTFSFSTKFSMRKIEKRRFSQWEKNKAKIHSLYPNIWFLQLDKLFFRIFHIFYWPPLTFFRSQTKQKITFVLTIDIDEQKKKTKKIFCWFVILVHTPIFSQSFFIVKTPFFFFKIFAKISSTTFHFETKEFFFVESLRSIFVAHWLVDWPIRISPERNCNIRSVLFVSFNWIINKIKLLTMA